MTQTIRELPAVTGMLRTNLNIYQVKTTDLDLPPQNPFAKKIENQISAAEVFTCRG
jgi:hypothetical protein